MYTFTSIKIISKTSHYFNNFIQKKCKPTPISLIDMLRHAINETQSQCKPSTRKNKVTAVNTLQQFLREKEHVFGPITIDNFTPDVLKAFERWALDEGQKPNYVALHMRCLRSLINRINGRGNELFKHVRTTNCQTKKRAVSEDAIKQIRQLKLKEGTSLDMARDIFLFCFHGMGIPLIDGVMLKKSQLTNNEITYRRHKTGRMVTIPVSKELKQLLNRLTPKHSPYLLPILTAENSTEAKRQYRQFYQRYMRALKKLETLLDTDCHLTSYTPRHSWASIAYKNGVNINIIAQALGHSNTNTTYSYIQEINNFMLESANSIVTKAVM